MNLNLKTNRGFTLIELVVVIVILGILAATAAPKFINIKSDAVIANLNALEGAIKSANQLIYSKSIVQSELIGAGVIAIGTVNIDTSFTVISSPTDSFTTNWGIYKVPNAGVQIFPNGYDISSGCMLYYIDADADYTASYSQTTNGC